MSPPNNATSNSPNSSQQTGPVGSGEYTVQAGDCLSSLAYEHGITWEKIWNDPGNAAVKTARKDPNILYPGDRLHIPEIVQREESCATEKLHRFVRKGVPEVFNIIVKREGRPVENEAYTLTIDGKNQQGTTDSQGRVKASIPPNAHSGTLTVGTGPTAQVYMLNLGHMDPITEISGIQARLRNLGYDCGEDSNEITEELTNAIKAFQAAAGLQESGELDNQTRDALQREHGS